jgi:CheY-like chemotaxis protein
MTRAGAARILLIDDDDMFRKMVRVMLVSAGYRVEEADSGATALASYRQQPCDLVITDILMPDMDGIETIRALVAINPRVRIIAVSGSGSTWVADYLEDAQQFGARRILQKPVSLAQLLSAVSEVLAS